LRIPQRKSWVRCPHGPWPTVLAFLAERFAKQGLAVWAERMRSGAVCDEAGEALALDAHFTPGQLLSYVRAVPHEADHGLQARIVYQDDCLLVADKPHFMPVTPGGEVVQGSLLIQLQAMSGLADLQPLHRIDAETAGLVAFSVRKQDRGAYQAMFRDKLVSKTYLAVSVSNATEPEAGKVIERHSQIEDDPVHFMRMREAGNGTNGTSNGNGNAHSRIECLGVAGGRAHWRLRPISGKRHQLRVHMNALDWPLLHDRIYPNLLPARDRHAPLPPALQLLAQQLAFKDPLTGIEHHFCSHTHLSEWRLPNSG
jgi:tRNA pseudouridine32 synthase / 23S rRNA pseudouridine746 synthase